MAEAQSETSNTADSDAGMSPKRDSDLTRDDVLEVLSNRRRRYAIHYLKRRDGEPVAVSELTDSVASWENEKEIDALNHRERKRVRNALRQFHLPKMDEYGFVDYNYQRGIIELTEAATDDDFYVDSLPGRDIPWGVYYLGLSAVSVACLLGIWIGAYPFSLLSPLFFGVFFVTALSVSSAGHLYDNYCRMRLGARDRPAEVAEE